MPSHIGLTRVRAMAVVLLVLLPGLYPACPEAAPAGSPSRLTVSFKLDQRLSGPTYGGVRWVSPPTLRLAQGGEQLTVEAKAQGVGADGSVTDVSVDWTPVDPDMVLVTRGHNQEVTITVKRAGVSTLHLAVQGVVSKELVIKAQAMANGNGMQVEIAQ